MSRIRMLIMMLVVLSRPTIAQDTLPEFSVISRGNRVFVSWTNKYPFTSQISIQRSADSTRQFKTILTVPDPGVAENGYVDTHAPQPGMFYRLFIVLDSGKYLFTRSRRPLPETPAPQQPAATAAASPAPAAVQARPAEKATVVKISPPPKPEKFYTVSKRDTLLFSIPEKDLKKFRDSMAYRTKDTLVFVTSDSLVIRPFVPREVYKPSAFVYTGKDGHVTISLPWAGIRRYSVQFYEADSTPLFRIPEVKTAPLVVDKANFMHAGWFLFDLYEDGKLKERHRLYIPKEF